jgi:hypothetical protein
MKSPSIRILAVFLAALTGFIPAAFAQTTATALEAKDILPADTGMLFELNTSVSNPLEDLIRSELADPTNEISTLMLSLAKNNIINLGMGNLADMTNPKMYLTMKMTEADFNKLVETSKATESETYNNIKIYKMEESASYIALVKNLLVITDATESIRKTIDNQAHPADTIGSLAAYKSVTSHDLANSFLKIYLDPSIIIDSMETTGVGTDTSVSSLAENTLFGTGIVQALDGEGISVTKNDGGFGFGVAVHADSAKLATSGYAFDKYNFNPSLYQMLSGKGLLFYQERSNLRDQFNDFLKMAALDTQATADLANFKVEFKKATLIDFDRELLPLLDGKYMITVHNVDQLLPAATAIFKVNDANKGGAVVLKLSDYINKTLKEEQANYTAKIFDSTITNAGGTAFYDYTIYLKAMDTAEDMKTVTDEAATLHLRLAVTTDGYLVISTLPDLDAMFRKSSEGLLENAGLKAEFTDPTSTSNDVVYLDIDSLGRYVGTLMNFAQTDSQTKDEVAKFFAPWHGLFMRGESTSDTVWVKGQLNVDVTQLGDFTSTFGAMMNAFDSGLGTSLGSDFNGNISNQTDVLAPFGVEKKFCDVSENDWFYPYVTDLSSQMIVSGYEDGCFRPNQPVTRAEFVKMAMKALDKAAAINSSYQPFKDVPPINDTWYSEDINMAATLGYVNGYSDGTFGPDKTITRAEAIQILYNMSTLLQDSSSMSPGFTDVKENDWFRKPVTAAYNNGIINGTTPATFEPNRDLTRAEAVKIIDELLMAAPPVEGDYVGP